MQVGESTSRQSCHVSKLMQPRRDTALWTAKRHTGQNKALLLAHDVLICLHRKVHKRTCAEADPATLPLKLAERALAVPNLVDHINFLAVYTLELLKDASEVNRSFTEISCSSGVADLNAYLQRMMSGQGADPNAQVCATFSCSASLTARTSQMSIHTSFIDLSHNRKRSQGIIRRPSSPRAHP